MKFTQFKKWFSVMAFAVTALFVTQTVRAENEPLCVDATSIR